jgi:hypothetical protein
MSTLTLIAIISGILQMLGYVVYMRQALTNRIIPNATTWLMFAYGTVFLTILEFDLDGAWELLVLPIVCSICGISISIICRIKQGRWGVPEDRGDFAAFSIDLVLTALYFCTFLLGVVGVIDTRDGTLAAIVILLATNASTIFEFIPNIRSVRRNPESEHWLAWGIWTLAYASLLIVTYLAEGVSLATIPFFAYPLTCVLLHGTIAWYASRDELRLFARAKEHTPA